MVATDPTVPRHPVPHRTAGVLAAGSARSIEERQRDRHVPVEVGVKGRDQHAGRGTRRGAARPRAARPAQRRRSPAARSTAAPCGGIGARRRPSSGPTRPASRDADRPEPARCRWRSRSRRPARRHRGRASPRARRDAASRGPWDAPQPSVARSSAVDHVPESRGRFGTGIEIGRERDRRVAVGQRRQRGGPASSPVRLPDRHAGDHAVPGVQRVRDRLGGCRCRCRGHGARRAGHRPASVRSRSARPMPRRLHAGQHEQHAQEPDPVAHGRRREAHPPATLVVEGLAVRRRRVRRVCRDQEPVGVRAEQVREQRCSVARSVPIGGWFRRPLVVIDAVAPDPGARSRSAGVAGRYWTDPFTPRRSRRRRSPPGRSPARSSSACINASRSPSRTAPVFESRRPCAGP